MGLGMAFCHLSHAQNDTAKNTTIKLSEVEIETNSNKSLTQPASVAKLTEVELKRGNGLYLDDAINQNVPGVFMQRRAASSGQQFNIRGYGNGVRGTNGVSSNFDGQGYKVYLNGIPITDAEGITLMDDIDFNSIGNVEVIKGPTGTLYGLAIAGVVNLKTATPAKGKTSVGQDVMFGSYGLSRFTTHAEVGGERSSFLVNYGHQTYDGFIVHTASHKDFVNVMGNFQPNEKQSVSVYAGYSNSYDERQGELTIMQYDTNNYSGNPAYIKNNAHSNIISFRAGVGHTYTFNKYVSNTLTVFGSGVSNNASSAGGWTDKTPVNYGARTTFDLKFMQEKKFRLNGVLGAELQQQFAQVIGYGMVANPNPDPYAYNTIGAARSNIAYRTETSSAFTEWTLGMPMDFSLTAGIGVSNMLIVLNDRFYVSTSTNPTKYAKGYDNMFSPHVALNKVFKKHISAYISYSKGYKAPTSSYFFIPTTGKVNTELSPEAGDQFEIGSKGDLMNGKLYYEVAVFNTLFSNKMTTVAVPLDPPAVGTSYSYIVNRGGQDNKGVEALLKYTVYSSATGFFKAITPWVNVAYSDFRYVNYSFQTLTANKKNVIETDYSGNAVAGVAPVTANAGVDINTKIGVYANVNYLYRDGMPITSDGLNMAPSYSLLNAKLGFRRTFLKRLDLDVYAGATNITSEKYSYMIFVNQLPDAYMPAPNEINYFGGVNLKFNF
ncbi:MAG: outer rane receptor protein [Bacteroidetes bacterium]|nr:outer rane receptor protein [Bacteroidota bacterium]